MANGECGRCVITAVEINTGLAERLRTVDCLGSEFVHAKDFLTCNGELGQFERVLMNPPFGNAQDVEHIMHALHFLKAGGRLVALCANGPRQREKLLPIVEERGGEWIDLPAGSFKESGTGANVALVHPWVACLPAPSHEGAAGTEPPGAITMAKRISGEKLRALMKRYKLDGDSGADVVADLLHTSRPTVQGWYSKGVPINEFELLTFKLEAKKTGQG
jgi:hypothetical protein